VNLENTELLSEREQEILRQVATGASNKEIASSLNISPNTVKVHLRNIFSKINVVSRTEATLYAIRIGLISSPGAGTISDQPLNGEAILYNSSPLAGANESLSPPKAESPKSSPFWLGIYLTSALIVIGLLTTALILSRRPSSNPPQNPNVVPVSSPRWETKNDMPASFSGAGIVGSEGKFYLIGGIEGINSLSSNRVYDPIEDAWNELPQKPTSSAQTQAVMIQEKIYLPGGLHQGQPSAILEAYDLQTQKWETKSPLPIPLSKTSACAFEGKLYLFGGWDGTEYTDQVFRYDPDSDRWLKLSPLPLPLASLSAVPFENRVLLIGGENEGGFSAATWAYYPSRDDGITSPYETEISLPYPRARSGSAQLANMVYLFGGTDQNGTHPPGLIYDPAAKIWNEVENPIDTIGDFPAVIAGGNFVHVFGGRSGTLDNRRHLVFQALYTIAIPLTTNQ
jgi:DNA-binding CsgD family transcriptional regulator